MSWVGDYLTKKAYKGFFKALKDVDINDIFAKIDLSKLDLSKIDLSKIDISKVDISKIDLNKINPRQLREVLHRYNFRKANNIEIALNQKACDESAAYAQKNMLKATVVNKRLDLIDIAISSAKLDGFVVEVGVFKGESLNYFAKKLPAQTIYGFDTFEGLPDIWRTGRPAGSYNSGDIDWLTFEKNCKLYKGLCADTLPGFKQEELGNAKLIHIDCDLYQGAKDTLTILNDRIVRGTVILFDEYFNYPDWQLHEFKAFQEFISETGKKYDYLAFNQRAEGVAVIIL